MTTSNIALLDTNILVYAADTSSLFHEDSLLLREKGLKGELSFCICPQTLTEFFAIVTDSKRVSKPRTQKEALEEIEKYLSSKTILKIYPGPEVIETMINLLKKYKVTKQKIFDLQLVATMLSNNVTQIYTYNKGDFSKFEEITVLSP